VCGSQFSSFLQPGLLPSLKMLVDNHIRLTYNEIHKLIGASSAKIQEEFAPDILIAIGSVPIMVFSGNLLTSDYSTTRRRVSGIGYEGTSLIEILEGFSPLECSYVFR